MIRNVGSLTILLGSACLAGCVSVQLPQMEGKRAQEVQYSAPSAPFSILESGAADKAWLSGQTGNTISYLSDCAAKVDPELDQILDDTAQILESPAITERSSLQFNGRAARAALVDGKMDGVPVRLKLLVFKKNDCSYTISYTAKPSTFAAEITAFERFVTEFRAP